MTCAGPLKWGRCGKHLPPLRNECYHEAEISGCLLHAFAKHGDRVAPHRQSDYIVFGIRKRNGKDLCFKH